MQHDFQSKLYKNKTQSSKFEKHFSKSLLFYPILTLLFSSLLTTWAALNIDFIFLFPTETRT